MNKNKTTIIFLLTLFLLSIILYPQNTILKPNLENETNIIEWLLDSSGLWKIENNKLLLYQAGKPSGEIRRPSSLAIFISKKLVNVSVEADIKSTADTNVIRRDIDIVIGYESPTKFYYVHLAGVNDDVHNGIFLVNNADRKRIDSGKGIPQLKDQKWHHVKVERIGRTGKIDVYVDGSDSPVLSAIDKTITEGQVGFGSFDDTAEFKNIVITEIHE